MLLNRKFLIALLLCYPCVSHGIDVSAEKSKIESATDFATAEAAYKEGVEKIQNDPAYAEVPASFKKDSMTEVENQIAESKKGNTEAPADTDKEDKKKNEDTRTAEQKKQDLEDKKKAYDDAKAKEQSTANKTLTALTTAATGIGGMELAMGLSEKKADEAADQDMNAYLLTFRCTYANGKVVKGGPDEIELPGGNDEKLMKMRSEYIALAADLKERKEALGMKPGIEAEKIYDKAEMGLYDDENVGITSGVYESLYRAKALNSEEDQAKIDAQHKEAKNRMIAGGVLAGAGVIGGMIGNSAINGKLGEAIKKLKENKGVGKETKKALKAEADALEDLQKCMKKAGFQNSERLSFDNFFASAISVKNVSCKDITLINDQKAENLQASDVFIDSSDETEIFDNMAKYLSLETIGKMIGSTLTEDSSEEDKTKAKNVLKRSLESAKKKIEAAAATDEANASSETSSTGSSITDMLGGSGGMKDMATNLIQSKMGGGDAGNAMGALSGMLGTDGG